MHSYDRTLLSRLGFADPDRKNPEHTMACLYLADPVGAERLIDSLFRGRLLLALVEARQQSEDWGEIYDDYLPAPISKQCEIQTQSQLLDAPEHYWQRLTTRIEVPINKGHAQYQTTIGFVDVQIEAGAGVHRRNRRKIRPSPRLWADAGKREQAKLADFVVGDWTEPYASALLNEHVCVEVKTQVHDAAEVIRQITLYREYMGWGGITWGVVSCTPIAPRMVEALQAADLFVRVLGDDYAAWKATVPDDVRVESL